MNDLEVENMMGNLRKLDGDAASHVRNVASTAEDPTEELANMVIGNVTVKSEHELLEAEMAHAVASWKENIKAASDAGAMVCSARPVGYDGQMSLVSDGQRTQLVAWDGGLPGDALMGRPVTIDKKGRAVWVIPGLVRPRSYQHCDIVCPAVGLRLARAKGRERDIISKPILRLIRMVPRDDYKVA